MKILRTRKLKCGFVRLTIDASDEEIDAILFSGIERFVKENKFKLKVFPIKNFSYKIENIKKHDLTEDEEQYLLNIGLTSILCDHMKIEFPSLESFDKIPKKRHSKA